MEVEAKKIYIIQNKNKFVVLRRANPHGIQDLKKKLDNHSTVTPRILTF